VTSSPRWFSPLLVLTPLFTGCQQACELAAFGVGYLHGVFFGAMGVIVLALLVALLARKGRPFWSMFFTTLAFGLLGLVLGFFFAFLFDCKHLWLYRGLPWSLALALTPFAFTVVRRRAPAVHDVPTRPID